MKKRTKKTIYIVSSVLGIVVFAVVFVRATYEPRFLSVPETAQVLAATTPFTEINPEISAGLKASADTSAQIAAANAAPVPKTLFTIRIPSIEVDAHVEDVGVNAVGNIDTPKRLGDAAWYMGDAVPGEKGTAVIVGHVDNGLGLSGVFKNLKKLQNGDAVYVTNKDGTVVHFIVTDVTNYALADAPVHDILHDTDNPIALKLITCDKTWNGFRYHYDHRLVVTAVPA